VLENIRTPSTAKDHNGKERQYVVEHILEWQLLLEFLRGSGDTIPGPLGDRCAALRKYFTMPVDIDTDIDVDKPGSGDPRRYARKYTKFRRWIG
jgi:hypothetical protein